jgi:dTDP-glucose pyrophosphorylase
MSVIDKGACEIALVVDDGGRLLGTVTDGDIRRAILRGGGISSPVGPIMNRGFASVGTATARAEVLDLMRARTLAQVPIIDEERRLVGLHLLSEVLGAIPRPNWAVVMAGGRGERLRPLTDSIPKPMIKVAGRPILERIVLHLVGSGIRRVFLSVNYMRERIEEHFGDGRSFGCSIEYLAEEAPLGSGGSLSLLPEMPSAPLLVLNGDLVTQFDLPGILACHTAGGYRLTVGVHLYVQSIPLGVLDLNGSRVTGFREKPSIVSTVNAGIYVLEPALLEEIPRATFTPMTALIEGCLQRGDAVGAAFIAEDWIDVGNPRDLVRASGKECS